MSGPEEKQGYEFGRNIFPELSLFGQGLPPLSKPVQVANKTAQDCLDVLFDVCPYLEKLDSLGGSWFWNPAEVKERGYGDESLGALGLEDAVWQMDENDDCPFEALERFSKKLKRVRPDLMVEPYYSFLWIVSKR